MPNPIEQDKRHPVTKQLTEFLRSEPTGKVDPTVLALWNKLKPLTPGLFLKFWRTVSPTEPMTDTAKVAFKTNGHMTGM